MLRRASIVIFLVFAVAVANAQSKKLTDSIFNRYLDFNVAKMQGQQDRVLEIGQELIPYADKLPEKSRINFYFSVGKMYEDNDQVPKALPYYLKVVAAVPDYYVVHRALGYIYLDSVKVLEKQLNSEQRNRAANDALFAAYVKMVKKTLSHLEKAQACDPSDETLAIIKVLLKNIKDTNGLNALDGNLKQLGKNCIDVLSDN